MKERSAIEAGEIEFFAPYYEGQAYNTTGWRLRLQRELNSLLRVAGRPLKRVLSLGCGDGQFELMLAAHAEHVTGLDISPEAIALAKRMAEQQGVTNAEFRCQPLADLSWNDKYDCIVCLGFLHHVPETDLPNLFRQAHEHLVEGGLFYAEDPNKHGILRLLGRIVLGKKYHRYHTPDERELDPAEIRESMKLAGFVSSKIGYIDLTLIPALFVLAKGPAWPLYGCVVADWVWCHLPGVRRFASGFTSSGFKRT